MYIDAIEMWHNESFFLRIHLGYENKFLSSEEKIWIQHSPASNKTIQSNEPPPKGFSEALKEPKKTETSRLFKNKETNYEF